MAHLLRPSPVRVTLTLEHGGTVGVHALVHDAAVHAGEDVTGLRVHKGTGLPVCV